jgi:signal peptidase I
VTDDAGTPDEAASLNDPDWVEQMLARALDSAEDTPPEQPTSAESGDPARSSAPPETAAPAADAAPPGGASGLDSPTAESDIPAVPSPPVAAAPAAAGDPYHPAQDDDAAWSSWAAGGAAPAAAGSQPTEIPSAPDWTQQQTAAVAATAAPVVLQAEDGTEYEIEEDTSGSPKTKSRARSLAEWGAVVVGAIVIALLVKTFLFQAFYIPSGSMEPTLMKNDRVLVNKLSYDLHDVNRGDVVVFKRPPEEQGNIEDLIKRVIALPGETISFRDGAVFIDDRELSEPYLKEPLSTDSFTESIRNCEGSAPFTCTLPEERVFVMGDNRRDSRDSRFFGPIEESSIVGRAFIKIWPIPDIGFL